MPQNRLRANVDHWLWLDGAFFTDSGTESPCKNDGFHFFSFSDRFSNLIVSGSIGPKASDQPIKYTSYNGSQTNMPKSESLKVLLLTVTWDSAASIAQCRPTSWRIWVMPLWEFPGPSVSSGYLSGS